MTQKPKQDWRNDSGLSSTPKYKKKFAFFEVKCSDGSKVWLRNYYKKYLVWSTDDMHIRLTHDDGYFHTDFIENITESEYIIRKLAENL